MNCANHSSAAAVATADPAGSLVQRVLSERWWRGILRNLCGEKMLAHSDTGSTNPVRKTLSSRRKAGRRSRTPGFIPGVGAMYNGQFMKGIIHALTL